MATLARTTSATQPATSLVLTSPVPAPFPRELLQQQQPRGPTGQEVQPPLETQAAAPSLVSEADNVYSSTIYGVLHELTPSIVNVQRSCLMTLNDLLSVPTKWNPIVPDRRHSMPPSRQQPHSRTESDSSSALQTIVSNLRNLEPADNMIEFHEPSNDSELCHELRTRVERISLSLEPADAILANALVSLLSHFSRLAVIQASSSKPATQSRPSTSRETRDSSSPVNLFHILKRQLGDLQIERLSSQHMLPAGAPPVLAVEAALLWNRIDEELESVVAMCKERTENRSLSDVLPPQYELADYQYETPPDYESGDRASMDDSKSRSAPCSPVTQTRQLDEKMRLDLEGVAMAIDRLYMVAPQLHNQRVELKSSKLAQMERASREGMSSRSGKEKETDVHELEYIFELLGKASERSLTDQKVVLEGGLTGRLEKARLRDMAKKEAFVVQLAKHSDAGRFHSQDAVLQPRTKDPHAMLTLPEFIREPMPRPEDAQAMLTLPGDDLPPPHPQDIYIHRPTSASEKAKKKLRNRSSSAPSLSWLRSSSSRSGSSSGSNLGFSTSQSRPRSRGQNMVPNMGFDVHYVAETHENLHHVLVFLTLTGATPGADVEAEVVLLPPDDATEGQGSSHLVIRNGSNTSLPLAIPAHTPPGKREVKAQSGHYEIKLMTVSKATSTAKEDPPPFLDATQLASANPTSFICASCSLPMVQSTKIEVYRDLPSEHWEELVEAWMCHTDQKLHDQVVKHGQRGFWPEPKQALVGGSYILFEESSITRNNLHLAEGPRHEEWRLARCLCGAVIGRCQEHRSEDGSKSTVYRLLKYAIRPVCPMNELVKTPLSAFIVEDMMEFVQAHATYRFVIIDEEDELPRILIWLFKPSLRLAYATSTSYALPKRGSIHATKVLYKVMTPSERTADLKTILDKYPGFPQAEYLHYPMPICRRIAGLLRESNNAYPESLRFMTGLQVGWLHRA
ncbi:hypothetical protein L208DRAFT_1393157 [Tricholoma matsutake]|nr:hypothetical protein L208DRAFT_1393157 [Tricholoma matsutake 945]